MATNTVWDTDRELYADITRRLVAGAQRKRTAPTYAKALYDVLRALAKEQGQNPDIEVSIRAPGEPRHFGDTSCWNVCWEAGPYDWAIGASMELTHATRVVIEPYYGFDLCVYPSEFKGRR